VFATTNPDEPGLDWIKEYWGIPDLPDFNQTYERIVETKEGNRRLVFIPARLEDNPILMEADPKYIQYLESLKDIDPELYDAWRNGSWLGYGQEGSYYKEHLLRCEKDGRVIENLYDPLLPVDTWCDLGIEDSFSIGYFQYAFNQWRVIDYDEFEGESIADAASRMNQKGYSYRYNWAPHDIEVRELGTGLSRRDLAKKFGVNYAVVPNLGIAEGINAFKMRFKQLAFDKTKCDLLIKRLRRYHKEWDDKRGVWKAKPYHDINSHAADMMRYWSVTPEPIANFKQPTARKLSNYR
jgi:hypothetical protein